MRVWKLAVGRERSAAQPDGAGRLASQVVETLREGHLGVSHQGRISRAFSKHRLRAFERRNRLRCLTACTQRKPDANQMRGHQWMPLADDALVVIERVAKELEGLCRPTPA